MKYEKYLLALSIYLLAIIIAGTALRGAELSQQQIKNIQKCYKAGQLHDLGNTMAGICWVESKGGLFKVNNQTKDYGIAQNNIVTALDKLSIPDTPATRKYVATKLVEDDMLSIALGVSELLYWRDIRGRTGWHHYVLSYNDGTVISRSNNYSTKVAKAIKYLKKKGII